MEPTLYPFHVFKFGGTSVSTADRIRHVVALVAQKPQDVRRVVVVSALGGITDTLIGAIDAALARSAQRTEIVDEIRERYAEVLDTLAQPRERLALHQQLDARWTDLMELLDGVYLIRECSPRLRDTILSMGERTTAPLVAAAFRAAGLKARAFDASQFIRTDNAFGEANVDFDTTDALVQETFAELPVDEIAVVTGFIGSTAERVITTLGRSGSDYTATLLAGALDADVVEIWTDVDGVLSADPRIVPHAFPLTQISYLEAGELAYFGAKVLHPRTMRPLQKRGIPLVIKNTLNAEAPGTLITHETGSGGSPVKAVTAVTGAAVLILEGAGMLGVPGIAARAFGALAQANINVLMISQASSEQSICIVIQADGHETAIRVLEEAFALEIGRGDIGRVLAQSEVAVLCAVGEHMRYQPGLAGRMFTTLGRAGINVLAIAQGASERNISAVVLESDRTAALNALHDSLVLNRNQAQVFLLGAGGVGMALLEQIQQHGPALEERRNLHLRLVGLANSRHMLWAAEGIPLDEAEDRLAEGQDLDLDALITCLTTSQLERLVVVDATASDDVAERYTQLLEAGVAVVTPNKRANTGALSFYLRLHNTARLRQIPYHYEATVGAGLPVISTLRDLIQTGDEVIRIEGLLSGTLAFVFNQMQMGTTFSEAVHLAFDNGYTEPDPREDLVGLDVARKLLILAREMGLPAEPEDVEVESLVPAFLEDVPVDEFMERLHETDAHWQARIEAHRASGEKLMYLGSVQDGKLQAGVRTVGSSSPFHGLAETDNMIAFTTERYLTAPLVIRGPGAGVDVTASGVLADLIKAVQAR